MLRFSSLGSYLRHFVAVILLGSPLVARAQAVPPGEGLVADSTELRVLRAFYQATGGPQWANHTNWLTGSTLTDVATWYGVGVQGGDVVRLDLYANQLHGTLPASLGALRQLQVLSLPVNQLTGGIPASVGQLGQLRELYLWQNQFNAPLPRELGQLDSIRILGLQQNAFSGSIPAELGQLTRLKVLALNTNQLTGTIPATLGQLTQLQQLDLFSNQLGGPIPASLGQLANLQNLSLAVNQLTGPLPPALGQLHALERLELWQNAFRDSIPATWGGMQHLQAINLNQAQLIGRLPREVGQWTEMRSLSLYMNELTGPLPVELGNCRELIYLSMSWNGFTGEMPAAYAQCTRLQELLVDHNRLHGALPDLGQWPELTRVYLNNNTFFGPIPTSVGRLGRLQELALNNNLLSGALPDSLGHCPNLGVLFLQGNQLGGPLPPSLAQNARLYVLNASYNRFTGEIPAAWGAWSSMAQLDLSGNQLRGSLRPFVGMPNLSLASVSNNRLDEPLPAGLGQLSHLSGLYADNNQLPGPLPADLGHAPQLWQLTLSNNHLSGTVPASVLASTQLSTLYLQGNDFTGIEDLGSATNLPAVGSIGGNYLDFASVERLYAAKGASRFAGISYNPMGMDVRWQRPQPGTDTVLFQNGQALRLNVPGPAAAHAFGYQWQRLVAGQWVDLPGDTLAFKAWATAGAAEQGTYRRAEHNRWFTDNPAAPTELYSAMVYADLLPYAPLARNRPDDTNTGVGVAAPLAALDAGAPAPGDVNFVRTWVPRVALTDSTQVPHAAVEVAARSTTYLDGLGRPVQAVQWQASPGKRDLVQPQAYDALGREPRQYLPYADTAHVTAQGYHYRAISDQQQFYSRTTPPGGGAGPLAPNDPVLGVARTGRAFAESLFEPSPLNRVVAQGAPGEAWQVTSGHAATHTERPNTVADSVLRFAPGYTPAVAAPDYQGFYAAGELWGSEHTDEHGYRTLEWKDKQGQTVLRQVEANRTGTAATLRSRWLRTAYAYDDFGHLRYVLQPEATKRVLALGDGPAALPVSAVPFLFHYRYDGRGRQIAKQVPGTDGETVVVFDQLDRPVLSQDAAQHTRREWSWTKYDALGRVILSGLVSRADTAGQVTLQAVADADTATAHQYEERTSAATDYQHYSTDHAFPRLGQQGFGTGLVLNATYYDDYNFDNDAANTADASYDASTDAQFPSGAAPVADALRTTGLTTRTMTRVLNKPDTDPGADWQVTTTFYDERARPVQVQTGNARGGLDVLTTQLDFTGKVVQSVAVHQGPNHAPLTVAEFFTYDHTGRLLTTRQQLPGEARAALLDSVQYNEVGQALRKTLGTGRLKQEVDYAYNIRGWLTQLNDPYHPVANDLFNLSLHYEQGFSTGYEQYNGNLTGQTWRSARDGVQRAYGYVYDPLNRLLQGDFVARKASDPTMPNKLGLWKSEEDNYRLSFASYDDNGNLLTLRRRGLLANATHATAKQFGPVDALTYAYAGNRLQAVDDQVSTNQLPRPLNYNGAPTSLAGDFQEGGTHLGQEYLYDANGNLTQDRNKGITGIAYNHLNLPRLIHFGIGADSLVFRYTASGQKVAKLVYQTGKPVQRTDYLGPFQYEQDSLRFFPHAEGRVLRFVSYDAAHQPTTRYEREFTFKDHLGNLRLAYRLGQVHTYTASLNLANADAHRRETQQFDSLSVSAPIATATPLARTDGYAAKLNAGGTAPQPLGPLTQFAVQKGDTIRATAFGLYPQPTSNQSFAFSLAGFIASLLQPAPTGTPPGLDGARRGGLPLLQVGLSSATLLALHQLPGGVPRGYLRVLSFNEDSVLVDQRTVQLTAAALGNYETLQTGPLVVQQNGYVSVYVGNESAADVYFDDVTIEHRQGLQVQENSYEPWGLSLIGLDYASPSISQFNKHQFNSKEQERELGLNWQDFNWRHYDPATARFFGVDRLADKFVYMTDYQFASNNPVSKIELDGLEGIDATLFVVETLIMPWVNYLSAYRNEAVNQVEHSTQNAYTDHVPEEVRAVNQKVRTVQNTTQAVQAAGDITSNNMALIDVLGGGAVVAKAATVPLTKEVSQIAASQIRGTATGRTPTMVAAAADKTTGEIVVSTSGKARPKLVSPLAEQAPNPSLKPWPCNNCAETKAVNGLVKGGSKMENIEHHTVRIANGKSEAPCSNCQQTLRGTTTTQ